LGGSQPCREQQGGEEQAAGFHEIIVGGMDLNAGTNRSVSVPRPWHGLREWAIKSFPGAKDAP
jgi:hypothetical protein